MALKSKEWFYKQCLRSVKQHDRFSHLCWDILEKGIGQSNSTRGHVTQAVGACQEFLVEHPELVENIQAADPTLPFDVSDDDDVADALQEWLEEQEGPYGRAAFGYNYDTLRSILTPSLGGTLAGGGGGDDEFKRVLRLMAEFIS